MNFVWNRNDSKSSLEKILNFTPFIDEDQPSRIYLRRNSISLPALSKIELEHLQKLDEIPNEVGSAIVSISGSAKAKI